MQKTEMEQWREIAAAIDDLDEARLNLRKTLSYEGNVPKTIYNDQYNRLSDANSKLKSDLEDRMFKEHPDEASTGVFYGSD